MLCENPKRRTGLTSLFHEFVFQGLRLFPEVQWLLFAGPNQEWTINSSQIEVVRDFPANDLLKCRLFADHFLVPAVARNRGADVLVTVGFVPIRKCLPTVMQVFSLQHLDPQNKIGFGRELYRRWVMKYCWPKADLVITNSKFAVGQILSVYPEFRERLVQSYEGLQPEQFNSTAGPDEAAKLRAKFGLGPRYFLWISNFYPYKQADLLIAGYAKLDAELRRKHPLVMTGTGWEGALERAQEQVKALGITPDVKFLNWIDDEWLAPLYRQALALCLPSREETFGRCVIESMACGTPCIVNDIPIMREVTDGQAMIVDFRNTASVTEALKQMAEDADTFARLRRAGLERAQQFTFEKLATERIGAIQRLVAARRAGQPFAL
jgi:glycosyltransferase involved in cell wall biosynthesis